MSDRSRKVTWVAPFCLGGRGEQILFPGCLLHHPSITWIRGENLTANVQLAFSIAGALPPLWLQGSAGLPRRVQDFLQTNYASPDPQHEVSLFWETVEDEITLGSRGGGDRYKFHSLTAELGLEQLLDCNPTELSGGELARVILCSHILSQPDVLILDGILAEIDIGSRRTVLEALHQLSNAAVFVIDSVSIPLVDSVWTVNDDIVDITGTRFESSTDFAVETLSFLGTCRSDETPGCGLGIRDLHLTRGKKVWEKPLNWLAECGDMIWVLGPNGSGKSTFFEALIGLLPYPRGSVFWFDGQRSTPVTPEVYSYSPQNPEADVTEFTLLEEVCLAVTSDSPKFPSQVTALSAQAWLKELGVEAEDLRSPVSDSPRLLKLTSVLAALARPRRVYLLDEPTLRLSHKDRNVVARALSNTLMSGGIVLCSTHDELLITTVQAIMSPL